MDLALADARGATLLDWLSRHTSGAAFLAGSLRRRRPVVNDLDVVLVGDRCPAFGGNWKHGRCSEYHGSLTYPMPEGLVQLVLGFEGGECKVDVRLARPSQAGAALLWLTGPRSFGWPLEKLADARGWEFHASGLWVKGTGRKAGVMEGRDERAILQELLGEWVAPEDRDAYQVPLPPAAG